MMKTLLTELQSIAEPLNFVNVKQVLARKKFKTVLSAGMILLTVFWDSQTVYMTEFLEGGNTVNSAWYIETIKNYGRGCDELGGQHRRFCCCMTTQDRTLLAQLNQPQVHRTARSIKAMKNSNDIHQELNL
jgi:hypothetical protein